MKENKQPLISVIMPAYNAEKYIEQSIQSVLNQDYTNLELIIINDCSKDKTIKIIENYAKKDDRIKYYTNKENSGVAYTRNFGIEKANGEWIAFLDSDDIWKKEKLQKQIDIINKEKIEPTLIYTGSSFIDENNQAYNFSIQVPEKVTYKELLKQNVISCSSTLIKKQILTNVKMEHDNIHEDFLLWLKILKQYNTYAYGVNMPLLVYRISRNSKSGNKIKSAKMTYMVYKYMGLNFAQRIYYMFQYTIRSIIKYKNIKSNQKV